MNWDDWKTLAASRMFQESKCLLATKALFNQYNHQHNQLLLAISRDNFECNQDRRVWAWRKRNPPATYTGHLCLRRCLIEGRCWGTLKDDCPKVLGLGCIVGRWTLPRLAQAGSGRWCLKHGVWTCLEKADGAVLPAFALNLTRQKIRFSAVKLFSDDGVGWQQFK